MAKLLQAIDHDPMQYPNLVLFALGDIGDPRAVPLILPYLEAADPLVRLGAAKALGQIGDPAAVRPLMELLEAEIRRGLRPETHSLVCELAAALGQLGDPRAVPLIEATPACIRGAPIVTSALARLRGQ